MASGRGLADGKNGATMEKKGGRRRQSRHAAASNGPDLADSVSVRSVSTHNTRQGNKYLGQRPRKHPWFCGLTSELHCANLVSRDPFSGRTFIAATSLLLHCSQILLAAFH
jgi:hypothetical protein